jgi:predicted transcriptional regulator
MAKEILTIRIAPEVRAKAQELARERNQSLGSLIEKAVIDLIAKERGKPKKRK